MADDEPRGVHLSDKQLVFSFMAATVAAVLFFLFGVQVGRGVQRARGPLPDDAGAAAQVLPDGAPAEAPLADGVQEPGAGSGPPGGAGGFSYPSRLGRTPPPEQIAIAPPQPAEEAPRESAPPGAPAASPPPPAAGGSPPAPYTVQIAAVARREEADEIVKKLKARGYEAFVYVPEGGDRFGGFRVRIGSFTYKRDADALAQRLLREDKRYKPWVTR